MKAITLLFCVILAVMLFAGTGLFMYLIIIPSPPVSLMVLSLVGIALPLCIMLYTA